MKKWSNSGYVFVFKPNRNCSGLDVGREGKSRIMPRILDCW